MYFGVIHSVDRQVPLKSDLKFVGQNFKLLNPVLLKTTAIYEFEKNEDDLNTPKVWYVSFFHGSRFKKNFCIILGEYEKTLSYEDLKSQIQKDLQNKAVDIKNNNFLSSIVISKLGANEQLSSDELEKASLFIRGSMSLKEATLKKISEGYRYIDFRGIFIASSNVKIINCYRTSTLFALAHAYRQTMQQISEELAEILETDNFEELDKLYRDAANFNARFYFHQPVAPSNFASVQIWEDIRDSLKLNQQNSELSRQIQQVHQILAYQLDKQQSEFDRQQAKMNIDREKLQTEREKEQDKREAEREKQKIEREKEQLRLEAQRDREQSIASEKFNRRLTMIGLFISFLGLVQIVDLLNNLFK